MDWRIAVGGETYLKLKSPWKNENERKYEDDNLEGEKSKKESEWKYHTISLLARNKQKLEICVHSVNKSATSNLPPFFKPHYFHAAADEAT